jgi:hypothetical protein
MSINILNSIVFGTNYMYSDDRKKKSITFNSLLFYQLGN